MHVEGGVAYTAWHAGILEAEKKQMKEDISQASAVGLITDNTPRMGDVFALLVRYISIIENRPRVEQRLAIVEFLKKSMNANNFCHLLSGHMYTLKSLHPHPALRRSISSMVLLMC